MKTMKKTAIAKIAMAAVLILFALSFVTCEDLMESIIPQKEEVVEYLDWEYVEQPDGSGKMTLMLDGTTPFAHKKQRALSIDLAKMAHDYFEVVFIVGATVNTVPNPIVDPLTDNLHVTGGSSVARASWEIGQPAGISGVRRDIDYAKVFPAATEAASVIFVGKKTGKTLLGIGHLIEVKEGNKLVTPDAGATPPITNTTITGAATSVTFGVYPLRTNVGWYDDPSTTATDEVLRGSSANADELVKYPDVTFITAATGKTIPDTTLALTLPTTAPFHGITTGNNTTLRGGVVYPLYTLPDAANNRTIEAKYKISGMGGGTSIFGGAVTVKPDLLESARVIGTRLSSVATSIGIEIIKRTPSYVTGGQTFDAQGDIDMLTTVEPTTHLYAASHNAFADTIGMSFKQVKNTDGESSGIFAITFQCPVYAITQAASSNSGPAADKWYIRPGYQQHQYLLDNGKDAGGAIMLGTNAGDIDWLEIFTVGIGFSN